MVLRKGCHIRSSGLMNKSGSVSIRIYLSLAEEEDEDEDALLCIKEIRLLPVCTKILPSTVVGKISVYFQCLVKVRIIDDKNSV